MTTHFDLTDVAAHAASHHSLTGIQRVQLECVRALAGRDDPRLRLFASLHGAEVDLGFLLSESRSLGVDALFRRMRRLFGPTLDVALSPAEASANGALKLRRAAAVLGRALGRAPHRFGPRDRLYVGGAFWAHPPSVRAYEQAARDGCEVVVMIHDVLPLASPELADSGCRPLFERMLRLPARALTVSRHAQAEIERARTAVGAPEGLAPATVVPLAHEFSAAPRNFVACEPPSRRIAALERLGPFVLTVGTIEPRKNQLPLIGLWERLARDMGAGWPRLVVAGKPGWRGKEAHRVLKRADAASPYVFVEAPSDAELVWLYGHARFTVFPSLAEGWGLPIGESLWFGTPCVASNAASMPEVGGPLCAYADPRAIDSFAAPIVRLARDEAFHRASVQAIRASGLRTWAETAEALLRALLPSDPADAAAPPRRMCSAQVRSRG